MTIRNRSKTRTSRDISETMNGEASATVDTTSGVVPGTPTFDETPSGAPADPFSDVAALLDVGVDPHVVEVGKDHIEASVDMSVEVDATTTPEAARPEFNLSSYTAPVEKVEAFTPVTPIPAARPSVTTASCVRALEKSIGFGKSALYLEVAVNLAVFAMSSTGADKPTKRVAMTIYAQAGFDVEVGGADYKTVSRRISASADLFNKLGREAVESAMHGLSQGKAIDSLCNYLGESFNFNGINAVLEYVGKPVKQTNTPEYIASRQRTAEEIAGDNAAGATSVGAAMQKRRDANKAAGLEEDDGITVMAGNLSMVIPRNCKPGEIRAMIDRLTEFVERMEEEIGTPEDQRNREAHS